MMFFKNIVCLVLVVFFMAFFSRCASTKKIEPNPPFKIGEVYYQNWVAGVKSGGSGINLFIHILSNPKKIVLDSVYFLARQAKLEFRNNSVFIGRFISETNKKQDIIMSNEPYAEYGNIVPVIPKNPKFQLKENQCVVSYKEGNKVKYFKIEQINKKDNLQSMGIELKKP